ncbi:HK97 gp10 family phage protein [Deinococcus sedimenti]|uniref:HK97 gp10 family phage protein n=1 Tax=Deinococcus sedimenti TaxID=1867090 RepID=A0ABQ2S3E0_9DEIO|nr:HK97 gp10 family phage protein [Deinococcus sedimenti]GGR84535.1 hypothetical protein GCM10008960_09460 [Deinococcus sedimenti]
MSIKIKTNARELEKRLRAARRVSTQMKRTGAQAARRAEVHARMGADLNIYDTTPGSYERTGRLRRGIDSSWSVQGGVLTVTVFNDVKYAKSVEKGRSASAAGAVQQIITQPGRNPAAQVTLGRSGEFYFIPGPMLEPAAYYASIYITEEFKRRVLAALGGTA